VGDFVFNEEEALSLVAAPLALLRCTTLSDYEPTSRQVNKRVISNIMRLTDLDGNGTIDFGEFTAIFDKIMCA